MKTNSLVVVDLETSGVNPFINDPLSIGFSPIDNNKPDLLIYIKSDNTKWSDFARKNFDKFAKDWEKSAVTAAIAIKTIKEYFDTHFPNEKPTLIGHNIGFDVAFLRKLAYLTGEEQIPSISHRVIDTHTMLFVLYIKKLIPVEALSSDGAFKHFGINLSVEERHTALGDAKATKLLFKEIINLLENP